MKLELIKSVNTIGVNVITKKFSRLIYLEKEAVKMGFKVSLIWQKYVRYSK